MNPAYIFDVDGTLTPSRREITDKMKDVFIPFAQNNDVYLVSGSDYAKTVEQLGEDIVTDIIKLSYNCSGNSIWERGIEIYRSQWKLPQEPHDYLAMQLNGSSFEPKTGNHIEERPGAVNFSIVGRNANFEEREFYIEHDKLTSERENLVNDFNMCFSDRYQIAARIGGETGIDITELGRDKAQIIKDFTDRPIVFFGDKCGVGGNDEPLATAITNRSKEGDAVYHVKNWEHTLQLLTAID